MKNRTLPVKRSPAPKGIMKRLSAVTRRKQRVSASATMDEADIEDSSSKISRALTIIFMIHIVAIGLIFFHQNFLDGRTVDADEAEAATPQVVSAVPSPGAREELPQLSTGEATYFVKAGDNYGRIAAAHGVEESDLRVANKDVEIRPGLILSVPPKRIVAVDPPEVVALRDSSSTTPVAVRDRNDGLVEAVPVGTSAASQPQLVRPNVSAAAAGSASGETYVVQAGDTLWKISTRFNVTPEKLQQANGITDPRKMNVGMKLKIPR
jgi:LysM repeat protein